MSDVKKPKTDADPSKPAAEGEEGLGEEELEAVSGGILIGLNQPAAATAWKLTPVLGGATLPTDDTAHKDLTATPSDAVFKFFKK